MSLVRQPRERALSELLRHAWPIEFRSRLLAAGVRAGGHRSAARGAGVEFEEVREYVPGDDPRSVDQNVTARYGRPFVKRFVEERGLTVVLVADLSPEAGIGGFGALSPRAVAASVAACLGVSAARRDDEFGLVGCRGDEVGRAPPAVYVPPRKGDAQTVDVVHAVLEADESRPAMMAATPRADVLAKALRFAATRAARGPSLLLVASDWLFQLHEVAGETLQRALADATGRGHDVVALRCDRAELVLPPREVGTVRIAAQGHGVVPVDWRGASVRAAYSERIDAWRTALADLFGRCGVEECVLPVARAQTSTAGGPARALRSFFERRGAGR